MGRVFTPIEANRTLPLVRSIVADILACGRELRSRAHEESSHGEVREIRDRLRDLIAELNRIGCEYKDWGFEHGLVDFPGVIDGKSVLFCWRSDEPEISHYHGELDGYLGRQSIPAGLLTPEINASEPAGPNAQPGSCNTAECTAHEPSPQDASPQNGSTAKNSGGVSSGSGGAISSEDRIPKA